MTLTLAFLTILGACLGLRCNVRVLALASIASVALITSRSIEAGPLVVAGQVAAAVLVLQAGYFVGILLQAMGHAGGPIRAGEASPAGRPAAVGIERSRPT